MKRILFAALLFATPALAQSIFFTDGNGRFYAGQMRPGDRVATADEVTAWRASQPGPTFTMEQFLGTFTPAELSTIMASNDVKIRTFLISKAGQSFTMAQVKTALDYLVAQNMLTATRETAILASTAPTP